MQYFNYYAVLCKSLEPKLILYIFLMWSQSFYVLIFLSGLEQ